MGRQDGFDGLAHIGATLQHPDDNQIEPLFHETMAKANIGEITGIELRPPAYLTRPEGWFGASKAGGCARALSYDLINPEVPEVESSKWSMFAAGLGTLVHAATYVSAVNNGYEVEVGFSIGEPHKVTSDCDLVHIERSEGGDIKTCPESTLNWVLSNQAPRWKDVAQIGLAMEALGLDAGRVAYFARQRNDNGMYALEFTFTREQVQPVIDRTLSTIARVREMLEDGELAPRWVPAEMPARGRIVALAKADDGWSHWESPTPDDGCVMGRTKACQFCDYKSVCSDQLERETEDARV